MGLIRIWVRDLAMVEQGLGNCKVKVGKELGKGLDNCLGNGWVRVVLRYGSE